MHIYISNFYWSRNLKKKKKRFCPQTRKQVAEKNDSFIMSRETDRQAADRQAAGSVSLSDTRSLWHLSSDCLLKPACHSEAFQHTGSAPSAQPVLLSITATRRLENTPGSGAGPCWQRAERSPGGQTRAGRLLLILFFLIPFCFHFNLKGQQSPNPPRVAVWNRPDRDARFQCSHQLRGLKRTIEMVSGAASTNVDMIWGVELNFFLCFCEGTYILFCSKM